MKKPYTWTIKLSVDEIWVKDGFNPTEEALQEAILTNCLGYARPAEVKVDIISKPSESAILAARGVK